MNDFCVFFAIFVLVGFAVFVFVNEIQIYKMKNRLLDLDIEFAEKLNRLFEDEE